MTKSQLSTLRKLADKHEQIEVLDLLDLLEAAIKTLEWYADPLSYYVNGKDNLMNHIDDSDLSLLKKKFEVGGKRAREFLASLEGGDGE